MINIVPFLPVTLNLLELVKFTPLGINIHSKAQLLFYHSGIVKVPGCTHVPFYELLCEGNRHKDEILSLRGWIRQCPMSLIRLYSVKTCFCGHDISSFCYKQIPSLALNVVDSRTFWGII